MSALDSIAVAIEGHDGFTGNLLPLLHALRPKVSTNRESAPGSPRNRLRSARRNDEMKGTQEHDMVFHAVVRACGGTYVDVLNRSLPLPFTCGDYSICRPQVHCLVLLHCINASMFVRVLVKAEAAYLLLVLVV